MLQPLSATSRAMKIGITSDTLNPMQQSMIAYWTIRQRLLRVPGVANVPIWGERIQMLSVRADRARMEANGVSLDTVMEATGDALDSGLLFFTEGSYIGKGGLKDELSQTLNDADKLAKNLGDTNRQLQQVLQENRPGLHEFTQSTLTQVSNLVSDMQRFIAGLSRFVSSVERDPARLLFGERREGYRPQ